MAARMTLLEGVNYVLQAVNGSGAVTQLDASGVNGTSEAADAQRTLEEFNRIYQAQGLAFNTSDVELFTSTGSSPFDITFPEGTAVVRCFAPGRYRDKITIQDGKAFITDSQTSNFGAQTSIFVARIYYLDFENCPGDVQSAIVEGAARLFRQRKSPNREVDEMQRQRFLEADARVDRPVVEVRRRNPYSGPMAVGGGERS